MTSAPPTEVIARANQQSRRLRELLHAREILVMPGAYDTLSAVLFEAMGFPAIQGTSGGIAAVFGLHDCFLGREPTMEVYRRMVQAVTVPINADGENGFGGPAAVAETVCQMIGAGLAGMNLEDSAERQPGQPTRLVALDEHVEKLQAFMETKQALRSEFFLNARVDAFLAISDPAAALAEAIKRGNAYAELGADCIFFIRAGNADNIRILVREVQAPVSILADLNSPPISELQELGVARVSYGAAFARAALTAVRDFGAVLLTKGDPRPVLERAMPTPELGKLLRYQLHE